MSGARTGLLVSIALLAALAGCGGPEAVRGGAGTENPDLDEAALGVGLDKADIDYLVGIYTKALFESRFWTDDIRTASPKPIVAIWPIENATTQHLSDEMLMLLSSLETTLVNGGDVQVVARARQEEMAAEIGVQKGAAYDQGTAQRMGRQLGVQYYLTGKLTGVDERLAKERRVQYTLFIQVLELETGAIRFQQEASRSKAVRR